MSDAREYTPKERRRMEDHLARKVAKCADPKTDRSARARISRNAAKLARKLGIIVRPETCERCGVVDDRLEGHHASHFRPLEVRFLCQSCHVVENRLLREGSRETRMA